MKKPIKHQNIHKIAELLAEEPNLSHEEIAERIGSTATSVQRNRVYLNGAGGNPILAIQRRNKVSNDAHTERRRKEAQSPDFQKPTMEIEGPTFFHKIAKLDMTLPKLKGREVAKLIGSTESTVKNYRKMLYAAGGDPDKAARISHERGSKLSAQRTKDAAKWRAQEEWKASGIDQ